MNHYLTVDSGFTPQHDWKTHPELQSNSLSQTSSDFGVFEIQSPVLSCGEGWELWDFGTGSFSKDAADFSYMPQKGKAEASCL